MSSYKMPYNFILDYLYPLRVSVKKMFGNHAVYIENKIVLATRKKEENTNDNGLWIGTTFQYHESLKKQFSSISNLETYNIKKWLLLPDSAPDFEMVSIKICELIKSGDPRIGVAINR